MTIFRIFQSLYSAVGLLALFRYAYGRPIGIDIRSSNVVCFSRKTIAKVSSGHVQGSAVRETTGASSQVAFYFRFQKIILGVTVVQLLRLLSLF